MQSKGFIRSIRRFCAKQSKESWPFTSDPVYGRLVKGNLFSDDLNEYEENYPRRPFPKGSEYLKVFQMDPKEPGRLSISKVKSLIYSPPIFYALYSLMNEPLSDITSKLTFVLFSGLAYVGSQKIAQIREKEAREVYISRNYEDFYFLLPRVANLTKYLEESKDLPVELSTISKKDQGFLHLKKEFILYIGWTDSVSFIADGLSKVEAQKRALSSQSKPAKIIEESPFLNTLQEMKNKRKKPATVVAFSEKAGEYISIDIPLRLNLIDQYSDYIENLCYRKKTKFFENDRIGL